MLIGGILHLSPREAYDALKNGALLVDVREEYLRHFKSFEVPNAISVPFSTFHSSASLLPRDKTLIFADSMGLRSKEAVQFLRDREYTNTANLNGGISEWENSGLPLKQNPSAALNGACICRLRPSPALVSTLSRGY